MSRAASSWLRFLPLLGLALLVYLLSRIGVGEVVMAVAAMEPRYLLGLPPLIAAALLVQTGKWDYILRRQPIRIPFGRLFQIHMVAFFYGLLTPARLGYFVKVAYLHQETGLLLPVCSVSVVVDRLLDFVVMFGMAFAGSVLVLGGVAAAPIVGLLVATCALAATLVLSRRQARRVLQRGLNLAVFSRLARVGSGSIDAFYESLPPRRYLVVPFLLTIVNWVVIYSQTYLVARSLAIDIDYFVMMLLLPLGTVAALIPITISGLGSREAVLVVVFEMFGVAPSKTVAMSLVALIIGSYVPAIIVGLVGLTERRPRPVAPLGNGDLH